MSYRDDVAALAARKAALDEQLRQLTRERDETAKLLSLPVLPNIRVAAPCNASWDAMTGDDRVRHCGDCNQQVFNLSALTTEQAESLIREKHGDLCVRYYKRQDGTVLTADCATGVEKRKRTKTMAASIVTAGLFAGGVGGTVAWQPEPTQEDPADLDVMQGNMTMGKYDGYRSSCDSYVAALDQLAECSPPESGKALRDAKDQLRKAWAEVPPDRVEEICAQALPAVSQSITAACNLSETWHDRPCGHACGSLPHSSCKSYVAAMKELEACVPEASRQAIRDAANQMQMSLHQLPPNAEPQAEEACATALTYIQTSIDAMCKPR